ncbi:MAG: NAD-dependent epimerase/dehydratase family protein [Steroidobacteraceae bacterium]
MNVFVAGGTGVLGRAALGPLVAAGHRVRATARGDEKAASVRRAGAEPIDVDLYDSASVRQAIRGSEVLIRLTTKIGSVSGMRSARAWEETNRLRTLGARILVDAAIAEGVRAYVHESVIFVYRDGGSNWLDEEAAIDDGRTAILRAALQGEQEAGRFTKAGGRGIVLRFAGFYGADAPSTQETLAMASKRMLPRIGPGSNYFSSVYLPDAGRAIAASIGLAGGVYNVCDDDPLFFCQYLDRLTAAAGAAKPLRLPAFLGSLLFGDVWKYLSRSLRISNAKLKALGGWQPEVRSSREGWPLVASSQSRSE